MLYTLSERIKRMSSAKPLLLLALFFIIMYVLINGQPFGVAEFNERFGDMTPLDLQEHYTPQSVSAFMEKLGDTGRMFYTRLLIMLDFAFPLAYSLFWAAAIVFFWSRFLPRDSRIMYICLLPLAAGLADWLENLLILSMLFSYPKIVNMVAMLADSMTNLKNILLWISLLLLLLGLLLYLARLVVRAVFRQL